MCFLTPFLFYIPERFLEPGVLRDEDDVANSKKIPGVLVKRYSLISEKIFFLISKKIPFCFRD